MAPGGRRQLPYASPDAAGRHDIVTRVDRATNNLVHRETPLGP